MGTKGRIQTERVHLYTHTHTQREIHINRHARSRTYKTNTCSYPPEPTVLCIYNLKRGHDTLEIITLLAKSTSNINRIHKHQRSKLLFFFCSARRTLYTLLDIQTFTMISSRTLRHVLHAGNVSVFVQSLFQELLSEKKKN